MDTVIKKAKPYRSNKEAGYFYADVLIGEHFKRLYGKSPEEAEMKAREYANNPDLSEPVYLSDQQMGNIMLHFGRLIYKEKIKVTKSDWAYVAILLVCVTGVRYTELANLTLDSVNEDVTKLSIKGDQDEDDRVVMIHKAVQKPLREYIELRKADTEAEARYQNLLFLNKRNTPITTGSVRVNKMLQDEVDYIMPGLTFLHIRRSLGAILIRNGASFIDVATLLGGSGIGSFYNDYKGIFREQPDTVEPLMQVLFRGVECGFER